MAEVSRMIHFHPTQIHFHPTPTHSNPIQLYPQYYYLEVMPVSSGVVVGLVEDLVVVVGLDDDLVVEGLDDEVVEVEHHQTLLVFYYFSMPNS